MFCKESFLYDYIVPLGTDCLARIALNNLDFSSCSFPFDWLCREDNSFFEVAIEILLKGGQNFFDREDLSIVGQISAPHFTYKVFNARTGFMHIHEFSIYDEEFCDFEYVKETYQRRMDRLIRILSEKKNALFVCISQKSIPEDVLISKWNKLIKHYNNDNIDLLVLIHDDSKKETEKENVIVTPHIKVVKFNNGYEFSPVKNDRWFRNQKMYHKILLENCKLRPKVSVVLPTFNSEKYLKEAIDSILNQTFKNFELIIIDDYSTDRTREIIKSYKDHRIKLIDGDQKGLAAALNKGIRLAQGEYIARMDSDDISLPERFAKQVSFLDQNKSISLLGTWQQHFGLSNWIHKPPEEPDIAKMALVFRCDMCHSTVMFRKEDFVKNGFFYPEHSPQEDFELWGTVIGKLNVSNIPQILGMYRVSNDSITSNKNLDDYETSIVRRNLKKYFGIQIKEEDFVLVQRRNNPYWNMSKREKKDFQLRLLLLYEKIKRNNEKRKFIDSQIISQALKYDWSIACGKVIYVNTETIFSTTNRIDRLKVLGIPVLKVVYGEEYISILLFNKIPLFKIKCGSDKKTFRLFNLLPIVTMKISGKK